MFDCGKEFAHPGETLPKRLAHGRGRACLHIGRGVWLYRACLLRGARLGFGVSRGDENHPPGGLPRVRAIEHARNSHERVEAIRDLVRSVVIDGRVAIPPLIRSLADAAVEVRVEAARSLGPGNLRRGPDRLRRRPGFVRHRGHDKVARRSRARRSDRRRACAGGDRSLKEPVGSDSPSNAGQCPRQDA